MKLIVGLGNPGTQYNNTRHNIGFMFLDFLQSVEEFSDFKQETKFKSEISTGIYMGEKTILLKPQTFMNLSGEALRTIIDFYKIPLENIIVLYDDMSLEFAKLRFRDKGSAGGHNGVKNIIQHFGDNFNRIKIGIGSNDHYEVSDWVLSKFTAGEIKIFEKDIYSNIQELLEEKI